MSHLPRLLIIDDLLGRAVPSGRNEERASFCGQWLLNDVTGDESSERRQTIRQPVADVVFCRGQRPVLARVGDVVENDLESAVRLVESGWSVGPKWALVLIDLCFHTGKVTADSGFVGTPRPRASDLEPDHYFGLELLNELRNRIPDVPVVMLSSTPRERVSLAFSSRGALGFLDKDPDDPPSALRSRIIQDGLFSDPSGTVIGESRPLLHALRTARRLSQKNANILIRGESGTGKELVTKFIHRQSPDFPRRPLVTVNSGGLTPELYYSVLFGHAKGAFTGATEARRGAIADAEGGDLFLDEIGNMPGQVQAGLLRVLADGEVVPLGARTNEWWKANVRFISATNADLQAMIGSGLFRDDLYERLHARGGEIYLPPLRDRIDDIPLLAEKFVRLAEARTQGARRRRIEPETIDLFKSFDWPLNVRQLEDRISFAVTSYPDLEHLLPHHIDLPSRRTPRVEPTPRDVQVSAFDNRNDLRRLCEMLKAFSFASLSTSDLRGSLPVVERAAARLLADCLRAGLVALSRPTANKPDGEIFIQPALQLLTADPTLSASNAYDIIKRILRASKEVTDEVLVSDPVLKEAHERSARARPAKRSKTKLGDYD